MTYAEAFHYDRNTLIVHTRERDRDSYLARDRHTGACAEAPSLRAAVARLRGGR